MQYMGSKNKIAKYLIPHMLTDRKEGQWWVEPFVGGANMIDKVGGRRIGNDTNKYLIALLSAVRDGWIPPTNISKDFYYQVKNNMDMYEDYLIGFIGFLCSFGGKWWGGFAANSKGDNYALRGSNSLVKQARGLSQVYFTCGTYLCLNIPPKSIIYCDPPYAGTTKYATSFNHEEFWDWCRSKSKEGHTVFISEYSAPSDFGIVTSISHYSLLNKNNKVTKIENLYRYMV